MMALCFSNSKNKEERLWCGALKILKNKTSTKMVNDILLSSFLARDFLKEKEKKIESFLNLEDYHHK